MATNYPIPKNVGRAFEAIPLNERAQLLRVREMIFEVAKDDADIGEIVEDLRWGEPAYLTPLSKSGTTVRLGIERASQKPAMFFNCQTTLVEEFRHAFEGTFKFAKNRAVLLETDHLPKEAVRSCISAALRYRLRPKK